MKRFIFCALLVAFTTQFVSGADELPSPKNSFKVSNKAEFDLAVGRVSSGDEIVLADGVWRDVELIIDASGTEQEMIYVRGEHPDKTFISGGSQIKFGGDYLYLYNLSFDGCVATSPTSKGRIVEFKSGRREANHCVISDCHFDSCVPQDKSFDDVWINLYGTYNTVQRCYMGGKDNKGLYIVVWHKNTKADHHTIRQNYFYRPDTYNREENGQEVIRIGDSNNSRTDSSTIIEDNFFYRCNGEIEIISIKSGDNVVNRNTFLECVGCVTLRHGDNNTISNNYFIANHIPRAGGVRVINKGHRIYNNYFFGQISQRERAAISLQLGVENGRLNEYDQVVDVVIANNTLVNCRQNFSFGVGRATLVPKGVSIVANLIVTDQTSTLIDDNGTDTSGIKFYDSHLEGADGVRSGEGLVSGAYTSSTMTIAGITLPKLSASTTSALTPDYIGTDISGVSRSTQSPIGAIVSGEDTPQPSIAQPSNCGPLWGGGRPL
ncbi:MAG: polysaccharide lyase 6 family protein [Rikenellaceae bacterium]